jgi:hypothetical protein
MDAWVRNFRGMSKKKIKHEVEPRSRRERKRKPAGEILREARPRLLRNELVGPSVSSAHEGQEYGLFAFCFLARSSGVTPRLSGKGRLTADALTRSMCSRRAALS